MNMNATSSTNMNQSTDFETTERPRELAEYAEIPLRYPAYALLPFFGVVFMTLLVLAVLPRKYQSSTLIMVESDRASAAMDTDRLSERLATMKQEIESRTRLEQIIDELQPYGSFDDFPLYWQIAEMRRATHIRVQGNDAFSIEFVHRDPEMAMKVTNRLASLFIENTGKLRESLVQEARGFTESSLAESKKMLDEAGLAVQRFKDRYMGALPEQLETNLATLSRLQLEKQTVAASRTAAENRREFLLNSINQKLPSERVSESTKELAELKRQLDGLRLRYTEQHPDIQAVMARIRTLEAANKDEAERLRAEAASPDPLPGSAEAEGLDSVLATLDLNDPAAYALYTNLEKVNQEIQALARSAAQVDQQIETLQQRVELTPRIESELYALEKDYDLSRENYDTMLKKNLDAELAQRLEEHWQADLFRVLDPAHLPERPVSPNGLLFVVAGLFLGTLAGIVAAAAADYLDQSVKTVRQLESVVPVPVLATVPYAPRMSRSARLYS